MDIKKKFDTAIKDLGYTYRIEKCDNVQHSYGKFFEIRIEFIINKRLYMWGKQLSAHEMVDEGIVDARIDLWKNDIKHALARKTKNEVRSSEIGKKYG